MKEFNMKINGNEYAVIVHEVEESIAKVEVNGTQYEVVLDKPMRTSKTAKPVSINRVAPATAVVAPVNRPTASTGANAVKSPLPGVVLELSVKEGDVVKIGQKLLVLEAMKMENVISSDRDGTVTAIKANKGASVLEGDDLIIIS